MKYAVLRRLSTRLAFKQTITFALLVVILAWSAYVLVARHIYGQLDDELQDRAISVRSMLQIRAGSVKWLNAEADPEVRAQFERSMRYYELLDEEGHTLDASHAMAALHLPGSSALPTSVQPDHTTMAKRHGRKYPHPHSRCPCPGPCWTPLPLENWHIPGWGG